MLTQALAVVRDAFADLFSEDDGFAEALGSTALPTSGGALPLACAWSDDGTLFAAACGGAVTLLTGSVRASLTAQ